VNLLISCHHLIRINKVKNGGEVTISYATGSYHSCIYTFKQYERDEGFV